MRRSGAGRVGQPADADAAGPGGGARGGIAVAQLLAQLHPEPPQHVRAAVTVALRPGPPPGVAAALASRFMRSTQRITFTRCSFQRGSRPSRSPRPMAAASRAVGASAIRRCTAGAAPNFAAWYSASDVANVHGPAAIGAASGPKLLNSPHAARVNRKLQTSSRL